MPLQIVTPLLAVMLVGCMRPQEQVYLDDDPLARHPHVLPEAGIRMVFALKNECPNWNPALAIAERKAGCGGLGADDPKAVECRKHFACDVCQFLENETWPPAKIKVYPGGKPKLLTHAEGATSIADRPYTPGSLHAAHVELREARCFGPGVGIWPFWEDNIQILAKAMLHESLHLCKVVGGYGPSAEDPTTEDSVEDCF